MGVNLREIPDVEEVIIRTTAKDIIIRSPSVSEIGGKGVKVFQVTGEVVEEKEREKPKFKEEDVLLVAQQAGVSREKAFQALRETEGDLARAIMKLTA